MNTLLSVLSVKLINRALKNKIYTYFKQSFTLIFGDFSYSSNKKIVQPIYIYKSSRNKII